MCVCVSIRKSILTIDDVSNKDRPISPISLVKRRFLGIPFLALNMQVVDAYFLFALFFFFFINGGFRKNGIKEFLHFKRRIVVKDL